MNIWQLKTRDGRKFKVNIENRNQADRVRQVIFNLNKDKEEDYIIEIDTNICNGIYNIRQFENLASFL